MLEYTEEIIEKINTLYKYDNKFRERALLLTADEGVYNRVQQKLKEEEAARQERIENRRRKLRNMPVFRWMYKTGAN